MDIKRFTNFWVLILVSIATLTVFLPNTFAQDYTQWHLPDGGKARLGKGFVSKVQYSPDGTQLAVASQVGIWLYDAFSGEELELIAGHPSESISFSPDGLVLASGSEDGSIRLWDVAAGNTYKRSQDIRALS